MLPRGTSIFGGVGLFGEATFAAMSLLQTLTQTIKKMYVETKQFLVTRGISDLVTKDCNLSIFNSVNRMESVGVKWEKKKCVMHVVRVKTVKDITVQIWEN